MGADRGRRRRHRIRVPSRSFYKGVPLLSFPPFLIDLPDERLWKHGEELRVRRKPFAILKYLVEHPRRLITHDELVAAVWGKVAMSESLVRTHVRDLRQALGEELIETVVGRGYRFLADVSEVEVHSSAVVSAEAGIDVGELLIGREAELDLLEVALGSARQGKRGVAFVTGDPGIGKTMLVDNFVDRARSQANVRVLRGTCVEQYGSGEAYLPVLEALGRLCRSAGGERVIEVLRLHAPTWLLQMPSLVASDRLEELQQRVAGSGQPRMLREIAEVLEVLSTEAPLIVILDDLQWSDPSTLDLIAILGKRRDPARLLVIGTFRPSNLAPGNPLTRVADELLAHRQALCIPLLPFDEERLGTYLAKRFPRHAFPADLQRTLQRMTRGNPLFLATLLEELVSRHIIRESAAGWELTTDVNHVCAQRPDSIRRLIDTQIDRLTATVQRVLEAASVAGLTFSPAVVAHALNAQVHDVDAICETLADAGRFLQYIGSETCADGTIHSRYAFEHALVQDAALARNPSASVRLWHRRIAERLEAAYAGREEDVAVALAVHLEQGQRQAQAARYYLVAGERAARRFAHVEGVAHFEHALALVQALPEGSDRDGFELRAAYGLGQCLFQLHGVSAVPALERAENIARRLDDKKILAAVLVSLLTCRVARGHFREAVEYAGAVASAVEEVADAALRSRATQMEATSAVHRGRFDEGRRLLERLGMFDPGLGNPGAPAALGYQTASLYCLFTGRFDEALVLLRRAYDAAEASGDPFERTAVLCDWGRLHAWLREPVKANEFATRSLALAEEGSFDLFKGRAKTVVLWARAHLEASISEQDVNAWIEQAWDSGAAGRTLYAALFAAVCARVARKDRALEVISSSLASIERTDERIALPELHRLRGEILKVLDEAEAERAFHLAIEIAREQSSIFLELRASLSLYTFAAGAKKKHAREQIARLLSVFDEGLRLPEFADAKAAIAAQ